MTYNTTRLVAMATGGVLLATSAGLNVSASQDGGLPAVVVIVAVAFGTLIAVPCAMAAWRDRRWKLAVATMVLILAGEVLNGWNSFERILSVRADREEAVAVTNGPRKAAEDRLADAKADFERADDAATDEARHGGCRSVCHALREDADHARQEVDDARAALANLAPERDEHLAASRLGLDPDTVEVGTAVAFSVVLNGLGLALVAIGGHGNEAQVQKPRFEPRAGSSKARRSRPHRTVQSAAIELVAEPGMSKRAQVQAFVERFQLERGREPRFSEVQAALGLPKATASAYRRLALAA